MQFGPESSASIDTASHHGVIYAEDPPYGAVGDGTTDDRAAIQAALDAAETAAALYGSKVTVRLDAGKEYKVIAILFTPTSGTPGYGGLAMPNDVILDLNGATIRFTAAAGNGDGAWVFPKGLHTNTSDYGAGSGWTIMNGRLEADTRLGVASGATAATDDIFTSAAHGLESGETLFLTPNGTVISTVTAATDDIFTKTAHGLTDTTPVILSFSSGFTGITSGTRYFVRDADANTFKLAATSGGAAIDITVAGTQAELRRTFADITPGTVYFARDITTNTFKVATTSGGTAVDITTVGTGGWQSVDTRVGNAVVLSQCEDCQVKNISIGQNYYHSLEIQAGRNHLIQDVLLDPVNLRYNASPEIQLDVSGSAAFPKNSGFTHRAEILGVTFRRVRLVGFPPSDNGMARRIEFGHSAGYVRQTLFDECYFDGCKGSALTSSAASQIIMDFNSGNAIAHVIEDCTVRNCRFNHDSIHDGSACIYASANTIPKIKNLLVEGCTFTGSYTTGIDFGGFNTGVPTSVAPANRQNLVARNCTAYMGAETTLGTFAWGAQNAAATQVSGGSTTAFCGMRCESITFDNCLAVMPTTFSNISLTLRGYYGFYVSNNTSTVLRNCQVRFTHTLSSSAPASGGYFYAGRGAVDGVINSDSRSCHFVQDGFVVEAVGGAAAYRYCWDDDTITTGKANLLSGYRRGVVFKQAGSAAGSENDFLWPLGEEKTITATATVGAQTINKMAGSVNFAAAAASLVVTNSNAHVNAVIIATVATNDATMKSVLVVPAAGSFTIFPNAVPTAETRVNWKIE